MKKYGAVIATVCALSACGGDSSSDDSSSGSSSGGSEPESTTTADSSIDGQWRVNFNDPDGYDDYLLQVDSGDAQAMLYTLDFGNGCYFEDRYGLAAISSSRWSLTKDDQSIQLVNAAGELSLATPAGNVSMARPQGAVSLSAYSPCGTDTNDTPEQPTADISLSQLAGVWQLGDDTQYVSVQASGEYDHYDWQAEEGCYDLSEGQIIKSGAATFTVTTASQGQLALSLAKDGDVWRYQSDRFSGVLNVADIRASELSNVCVTAPIPELPSLSSRDTNFGHTNLPSVYGVWESDTLGQLSTIYYFYSPRVVTLFYRNEQGCFDAGREYMLFTEDDGWFNLSPGGEVSDDFYGFNRVSDGELSLFKHYADEQRTTSHNLTASSITSDELWNGYCVQ